MVAIGGLRDRTAARRGDRVARANGASSGTYHNRAARCLARQADHGLPLLCPGKEQGQGVPGATAGGPSSHRHCPGELPQALSLPPLKSSRAQRAKFYRCPEVPGKELAMICRRSTRRRFCWQPTHRWCAEWSSRRISSVSRSRPGGGFGGRGHRERIHRHLLQELLKQEDFGTKSDP